MKRDIVVNIVKEKKLTNMRASIEEGGPARAPPQPLARAGARVAPRGRAARGHPRRSGCASGSSRRARARAAWTTFRNWSGRDRSGPDSISGIPPSAPDSPSQGDVSRRHGGTVPETPRIFVRREAVDTREVGATMPGVGDLRECGHSLALA